jgi:hypothetical protein
MTKSICVGAGLAILLVAGASRATAQTPPASEPANPLDTAYVVYDKGPITLPLGIGFRIPSYNRVDGLALPWGPDIKLADERVRISPTVTYRSHIGDIDPYGTARIAFTPNDELRVEGGRSTFSNDEWNRSNLVNSLAVLAVGSDARNYFRADRVTAEFRHKFVQPTMEITPSAGGLHEFAWSTGSAVSHTSTPWSAFGKKDTLKMRRINPAIARGHTTSGLGGLRIDFDDKITTARVIAGVERSFDLPFENADDFTQLTVDAKSKFPTFGTQYFKFGGHAVFTGGDAPPQRFAYLGGSGTLSTVDQLAMGGDRLLFVEGEYFYPLRAPVIQLVGAPVISLRYAAGSAGVGDLPDFIQNIGVGVGLKFIEVKYNIDPSYKKTPFSDKSAVSVSLSLSL